MSNSVKQISPSDLVFKEMPAITNQGYSQESPFMLVDKYGQNIFGLTEENIEERFVIIVSHRCQFLRGALACHVLKYGYGLKI